MLSYGEWDDNVIKFKYKILKADYLSNKDSIGIKISPSSSIPQEWLDYLEGIYCNHKEDVQVLLNKKKYYGKEYQKAIWLSLGIKISEEELKRYWFGDFMAEDARNRFPLSKFLMDIYDQR